MPARPIRFAFLVAVTAAAAVCRADDVVLVADPPNALPNLPKGAAMVAPPNAVVVGAPTALRADSAPVAGCPAEPIVFNGPVWSPWVTFDGGVNFLKRSTPRRHGTIGELANLDTDEVQQSLSTSSLHYRFEASPDLALHFYRCEGSTWDLRWVGCDSMETSASLLTTAADPIGTRTPLSPFGFVLEQGADQGGIEARANSYLHSVQFGRTTVTRDDECSTLSNYFGVRYIYFRDALAIQRQGTVDNEQYGWAGTNNMLGLEGGLEAARHYGFLTLGFKGKVGGYYNDARLRGAYRITVGTQPNFPPVDFRTPADEFNGISGSLDLGTYLRVVANKNFSLRFGYDFLLMTNLVLGTENMRPSLITVTPVPNDLPRVTPGGVDAHAASTLWLHGLSVLMEVTW